MNTSLRDILKHSAVYGVGQVLTRLASVVLLPVYTRYLTPADYGVIAILDLSTAVLAVVIGAGINAAVTRHHFDTEDERVRGSVWGTGLATVTVLSLLIIAPGLIAREKLAGLLLGGSLENGALCLTLALAHLWAMMLGQVAAGYLRVQKWSALAVSLALTGLAINIALNLVFLARGWGVAGILLGNLIAGSCMAAVRIAILLATRPYLSLNGGIARNLLQYGYPFIFTGLLALAMHQADRFFLRLYLDLETVGIYSVAYSIGQGINTLLFLPFSAIWGVVVYEIAKTRNAKRTYADVFEYFSYALMLAMLALSLFARPVLALMASPEFAPAAELIPVIALAYWFFSLEMHFRVPVLLNKTTGRLILGSIAGFSVNVLGNLCLIPIWGVWGAAWTSVATYAAYSFIGLLIYRQLDAYPYPFARIAVVLALVIATFVGFNQFFGNSASSVASLVAAAGLWLAWTLVLIGPVAFRWFRSRAGDELPLALNASSGN